MTEERVYPFNKNLVLNSDTGKFEYRHYPPGFCVLGAITNINPNIKPLPPRPSRRNRLRWWQEDKREAIALRIAPWLRRDDWDY